MTRSEIRLSDPEHLALRILRVEPEQRQSRKGGFQRLPAAADFAQQSALRRQVRLCFAKDAPDDVEPVGTAIEGELWFGAAFARQIGHALRIDIGWIGEDEVVALAGQRREQVA